MRDLFILWITVQLVMIGYATVSISNGIVDGSYKCNNDSSIDPLVGALFPIAIIIPEPNYITEYCNNK